MYIALALVTGGLVSVMIEASGELQLIAGVVPALIIIHLSGLAASGIYRTTSSLRPHAQRPALRETRSGRSYSRWFVFAGILGVAVVLLSNEVYVRGGVVLTLIGTLAGQTLAALALERTRWFDGRKSPRLQMIVSLLLILPGSVLIGFIDRVGTLWIFLSWAPGIVLMVQQMMNSRNTLRFGTRNMLLLNYITALAALSVVVVISPETLSRVSSAVHRAPFDILLGGGVLGVAVTALIAFLLTRAPALQVTLGVYVGQIAVGIVLDFASSRPFSIGNAAGITMVVLGLLSGWVSRRRDRRREAA